MCIRDSQQQGIERHLHHPGGGESIAHLGVGHAHDVNALRQALKQGCDGITHVCLSLSAMDFYALGGRR